MEDFELWCETVGLENPSDKAIALMAWNACLKTFQQKAMMLQHEIMQARHELMACETALKMERQERAK